MLGCINMEAVRDITGTPCIKRRHPAQGQSFLIVLQGLGSGEGVGRGLAGKRWIGWRDHPASAVAVAGGFTRLTARHPVSIAAPLADVEGRHPLGGGSSAMRRNAVDSIQFHPPIKDIFPFQ